MRRVGSPIQLDALRPCLSLAILDTVPDWQMRSFRA
jgi:hypothetical protein